ncbi:hypothetical protein [Paenibacillus sp. NPDC058177]|uniref:hypothetical protein n=1 Tax=Paenibacillus sp. NPDC058177 TaxID=3346369 RepID=UPI0036DA20C4
MKKSIITLVVACILVTGTSAVAATSSMVGKSVAKEVTIKKNGVSSAKKAIIIDGVTYAPVRDIAESAGYTVSYKGDVVELESVLKIGEEPSAASNDAVKVEISTLKEKIEWYKKNIESRQTNSLKPDQTNLTEHLAKGGTDDRDKAVTEGLQKKIKDSEIYITEQQVLITAAEARIKELQAQLNE